MQPFTKFVLKDPFSCTYRVVGHPIPLLSTPTGGHNRLYAYAVRSTCTLLSSSHTLHRQQFVLDVNYAKAASLL